MFSHRLKPYGPNDHRAADRLEVVGQLGAADGGDVPAIERLGIGDVLGRELPAELELRVLAIVCGSIITR